MKREQKGPLKWSMIRMLLLCWWLPLLLITLLLLYLFSSMLNKQIEKTVTSSMDSAVEICEMQLEEVEAASKRASYYTTIKDSYRDYKKDGDRQKLYKAVAPFINQHYKYDERMLCTMLFFLEDRDRLFYTYNTYQGNNNGQGNVNFFKEKVQDTVIAQSNELGTATRLMLIEGRLYMIRNMVDSSFKPYAMIIIEVSAKGLCKSMESVWGVEDYQIYLEGEPLLDSYRDMPEALQNSLDAVNQNIYQTGQKDSYIYQTVELNKQKISFGAKLNSRSLIDDLYMLRYVFMLIMVFLIPLVLLVYYFFHVKVTKPVKALVNVAEKITDGDYGYQVGKKANSQEFSYLYQTFNAMSKELQYQFDTIYKEELELKDARIMALQSQINPHFLNNTLEIINWEARMGGNDRVSGMIEALGTMLGATMNRKQRRFVTLAEELSYVDAYLYIISRRFGSRIRVCREIDESLLEKEVPILIIQPIVENAVEHGVEEKKEGMVAIRICGEGDRIIIEVINDGALSKEDEERIDYLLNGDGEDDNNHHVSLGIRNVNRRIKIIYGEECGLTIQSDEENHTISRMVVKMQHEGNKRQ